jgi:hypothetical protein
MQYTIEIDGVNVSASQLNMVLTIDKTLDYGSFAVRNQQPEPYLVGDMVDIDINDGTNTKSYHFIVSADDVTQLPNGYFLHTLDIIELTKILEWQTESMRTFTQKVDYIDPETELLVVPTKLTLLDVVGRLQATTPIEKVSNLANTRAFAIDSNLIPRLAAIESPDFQFSNKNLKEILIEVFDFIDAIPRLTKISNSIALTADFYNEKGSLITEDSFYNMKRLNISDYSTSIDSNIKNLYDNYTEIAEPGPTGFKKLTSEEGFLTEQNAFLKTQYPIIEIVSLKIDLGFDIFDLTDYIVEKQNFDLLLRPPLGGDLRGRYKDNTLFFERFKPNINGLFDNLSNVPFTQRLRIENVLRSYVVSESLNISAFLPNGFDEYKFQIIYKAQIDTRTEVKRLNTDNIKYDSQVIVGQTDNVVRADRVLDRLFKLQQLLGNAEQMTSERTQTVNGLHELGDYTANDYVITTIEMDCNKEYIMAKYMYSQRYQKVSDFIGLNNEIRLYPIPLDDYKRNIYIEDFVEVSTTQGTNNALVSSIGILTFMNTFDNSPVAEENKPIKIFSYNSESIVEFENFDNETNTLIKPVTAYAGGNSLNFHVEFDNSTTLGAQLDQENTDFQPPVNQNIIYTNNEGEVFDFDFSFANDYSISNINDLPIVDQADIEYKQVTATSHRIFKDTREIFALTYSLHVIPEGDLDDKIIIGKYLVERNNLLKSIPVTSNQFEVVGSNTPYTLADNRFSRDTDTIVAQTYSISGERLMLSGTVAFTSWAIRKKVTKEMVVAVNQGSTPITSLWFNFRDKQTGVTYPSQASQPISIVKRPTQIALNPAIPITDTTISVLWVDGNISPVADEFELSISYDLVNWIAEDSQAPSVTNTKTFTALDAFTRYTIRIRARIGTDFSEYAYFQATTTTPAPNAPTNLTLTPFGDRGFIIAWDAEEDIFIHRIEISEENDFDPLISNGLKSTFFLDTQYIATNAVDGIDYDTEYFVRVRVIRDGVFSSYSSTESITTVESPITAAPTITNVTISGSDVTFTLVNTDNNAATLFADFSTGATQRALLVGPNASQTFTLAFTSSDSTIFAKAKGGFKGDSAVVSVQFVAEFAPSAPNIGAVGIVVNPAFNVINYTYSGEIVDGFVLERNPNALNAAGFGEVSLQAPSTARRFIDRNQVLSGQSYTYRVRAINRAGTTLSDERTVTSQATVPNAPTSLASSAVLAGAAGEGAFTLTWQRNSTDEDGFSVERRVGGDAFAVVGGTSKGQTIIDQVIQGDPNTTYDYRIIAFNEFGNSAASNTIEVEIE